MRHRLLKINVGLCFMQELGTLSNESTIVSLCLCKIILKLVL